MFGVTKYRQKPDPPKPQPARERIGGNSQLWVRDDLRTSVMHLGRDLTTAKEVESVVVRVGHGKGLSAFTLEISADVLHLTIDGVHEHSALVTNPDLGRKIQAALARAAEEDE